MAKTTSPLLAQLSMEPLLVDGNGAELFQSCIQHVVTHERASDLIDSRMEQLSDDDFWGDENDPDDWLHYFRPYTVIDGVLQIPVMGVLLSQFPWQLGRWATGYKYIEMAFRRGVADPNVAGIALVINSGGGEVAECFELCKKIVGWRDEKPVRAFASNWSYSAAFAVGVSAGPGNFVIAESGGVGSVGVVTAHVEYSKMMDEIGIKVTFIYAGAHKVDGNPYEELSPAAKKRTQARIDKIYGVFCSHVAENRGMDEADVRGTEALTYDADEAIEIGFADRIGALEEELVVWTTELAETGDEFMAAIQGNVTGRKVAGQEENAQGYSQEDVDAMVADAANSAKAEGVAEGAAAEHARWTGIMSHEAAKDKPKAAAKIAGNKARLSVEDAADLLADMPVEKPQATQTDDKKTEANNGNGKRNHFAEAMNTGKNPDISANVEGEGEGEDDNSPKAQTNSILSAYAAQTGKKRKVA